MSAFKVMVRPDGVRFSIDHQTFTLHVEHDPGQPKIGRYRWYARALRTALKRLAASTPGAPEEGP